MKKQLRLKRAFSAILLTAVLALCLAPSQKTVRAQQSGSKEDLTPTFWQKDPDADFPNEGRMYCAPAAVSDGLIYLARANGWKDLVPGTEKKEDQIKLVEELGELFGTDPKKGTTVQPILVGLESYVTSKGYDLSRLDVVYYRELKGFEKFRTGSKPDLAWVRSAVRSKDTAVIFLFSRFESKTEEDEVTRSGGHFVVAVGAGPESNEIIIHNPAYESEKQSEKKSLTFTILDEDFIVTRIVNGSSKEFNLKGYYEVEGPGLSHKDGVTAILEAVIVFSLKKQ